DPVAKGLEFDDAHDAEPRARLVAERIDELVAIDVQTRPYLTPEDAIRQPIAEEGRRARVLVVLRGVGRTHLSSDEPHHVVRVLLVIALLVGGADDVVRRRDDL